MKATELIGKKAVRTKPIVERERGPFDFGMTGPQYNYAFCTDPIIILKATDAHIIYKWPGDSWQAKHNNQKDVNHVLDARYCDDSWTDYDKLMDLNEPVEVMEPEPLEDDFTPPPADYMAGLGVHGENEGEQEEPTEHPSRDEQEKGSEE